MKDTGLLLIIGGAEDRTDECTILKEFIDLASGKGATIAILAVATKTPIKAEKMYTKVFKKLGANECRAIHINQREDANNSNLIDSIGDIDGIFITGGDQLRVTTMLGGTELHRFLHECHSKGIIIAGTSAGASVMSEIMILNGKNDEPPSKETVSLSPGLGLLKGIVIDQHFAQRGRIGRVLSVLSYNPALLGVGIDENTAIIVDDYNGEMKVIGENGVTIIDASEMAFSNVALVEDEDTLAIAGCTLSVLSSGYKYDFRSRYAIAKDASKEEK